jgi:hypothetical protein
MSATVVLAERNGTGSGTETMNPANLNMGSADATGLNPATYPILARANGCSYEKWIRLYVAAMGDSNIIDNFEVWLSSLNGGYLIGEGMSCNLRIVNYAPASYPSGGPSSSRSSIATQTMPIVEPSGPNLGISGALDGTITSSGHYSDYMVLQSTVGANTPAGNANTKTLMIQWDEQ